MARGKIIKFIMDSSDFYHRHASQQNALIRYKTIDRCLRNRYLRLPLDDLVEACSDALYKMEGILRGVSIRTVKADIQIMRSDKLGYNASIEVYDGKFYRYAEDDYSISGSPLTTEICELLTPTVERLDKCNLDEKQEIGSLLRLVVV